MPDSDSPLPNEISGEGNPSTASTEQASRWVAIYSELLEMETSVIEFMQKRLTKMTGEARRITEGTNIPQLEKDRESFESRLALWRDRLAELEA